jgi:uncharacterized protein with ParB-like and HNH nuclease domain
MIFEIKNWKVADFEILSDQNRLDLNPPYQRNFIWNANEQKALIDSILSSYPLPSFFFYLRPDSGIYEVVDGQQRCTTILQFVKGKITNSSDVAYSSNQFPSFIRYELPVTVITQLESGDSLEKFYALVNKTGRKLNRSELNRAEFGETRFYSLVNSLVNLQQFRNLNLFSKATVLRMNDRDFVEEIVAFLKFGPTDKKQAVDELYHNDITAQEESDLKRAFKATLNRITKLNAIFPLNATRFDQKNDFYTLFHILHEFALNDDITASLYRVLVLLASDISPSVEGCETLREYALNCVSQSNSRNARMKRFDILKALLLNNSSEFTPEQEDVAQYYLGEYAVDIGSLVRIGHFHTFSERTLNSVHNLSFNGNA